MLARTSAAVELTCDQRSVILELEGKGTKGLTKPLILAPKLTCDQRECGVKQVSYHEIETVYQAGLDIEHAQQRLRQYGGREQAQEAWNSLDYYDREGLADKYEVFRFVTTTEITKVDPPYTRNPK
jgi:hypothetical protein